MRSGSLAVAVCAAAAVLPSLVRAQTFTQADKETMLAAHNQVRCGVTPAAQVMPPLAWDGALEATAQAWANQCQDGLPGDQVPGLIDHNPNRASGHRFSVGENIYASTATASPTDAVQGWAGESDDYDLATDSCAANRVCGHYTQIVWANTRFLGCARSTCPNLFYSSSIVCDYGPAGNVTGQPPYQAGAGVNGACDLIFQDGLEFESLSPWSSAQTDGGDLSVTVAARLAGTKFGLQALVDDTAGVFVVDETPADENRYRARFYFDPNGFDPGEGQSHFRTRIFIAFEEPNRRLVAVVLRRIASVYSLMARVQLDDTTRASTPFVTISDGPHSIEIDWRRSTAPAANNGSFAMWIDGNPVPSLTTLDNSASAVDFVRLGALSVKAGASGTMYWDEFESRRQTDIGP